MTDASENWAARRAADLSAAGRPKDALHEVHRALASAPEDATLHVMRAHLLTELGQPDDAAAAAREALHLDPLMGEAHEALARALIDSRKQKKVALQAARRAVELRPGLTTQFTLVRALLLRRTHVREAQAEAERLRREEPDSATGSLALALVAMKRAGVLTHRRVFTWWGVLALVLLTRGAGVLLLALGWAISAAIRGPHLRRADEHLRQALRLDPQNPHLHAIAGDVLAARFRYGRALQHDVIAGSLRAGLIDADELVASIARRHIVALVAGYAGWLMVAGLVAGRAPTPAAAAVTTVAGLLGLGTVAASHRQQARSLPRPLRDVLHARVGPVVAMVVITGLLGTIGRDVVTDAGLRSYVWASAVLTPVAGAWTILLTVQCVRARIGGRG